VKHVPVALSQLPYFSSLSTGRLAPDAMVCLKEIKKKASTEHHLMISRAQGLD